MAETFTRKFNSFSGADITALFNNTVFGSLQHLQYSIAREKARIYTMGSPDPRSFSRGKRSIGGALVFVLFDRNALIEAFKSTSQGATNKEAFFYTSGDELRTDSNFTNVSTNSGIGQTVVGTGFNPLTGQLDSASLTVPQDFGATSFFSVPDQNPWYADQIPPFQISIVAANEYGAISTMKLFNVELLEEGSGVGIDDVVIEEQYSFICTGIQPWTQVREGAFGFGKV